MRRLDAPYRGDAGLATLRADVHEHEVRAEPLHGSGGLGGIREGRYHRHVMLLADGNAKRVT